MKLYELAFYLILIESVLCGTLNYLTGSSSANLLPKISQDYPTVNYQAMAQDPPSSAQQRASNVITEAQKGIRTPQRSIDSLFTRIPTSSELDEMVKSADSVTILKTIQTLVSNDALPCKQILSYLLELLGKIRSAAQEKQFAVDQLKVIVQGAKAQIQRLSSEISFLEKSRQDLQLQKLRQKMDEVFKNLEKLYRRYNYVENMIAPEEAKIAGYSSELTLLQRSSQEERTRMANDKLKLVDLDMQIYELKQILKEAENERSYVASSLAKSEAKILENDKMVQRVKQKITETQIKVKKLRDQSDSLRRQYSTLEIKLQRIRADLSVAQIKDKDFVKKINIHRQSLKIEEKKLAVEDLADLEKMLQTLRRMVPSIETEIDRQYFYCYGDGSVEVTKTGDTTVYIVRGDNFDSYINTVYGEKVPQSNLQKKSVELRRIQSFEQGQMKKFSCLSHGLQLSGNGVVESVDRQGIRVKKQNGESEVLNIGSCSRIQSTSGSVQKGQQIVWKGIPSAAGGFNIYQATCW